MIDVIMIVQEIVVLEMIDVIQMLQQFLLALQE
jgi:hypothetical protein